MNQEDNFPLGGNGIGEACECEGDFDEGGDLDSNIAVFGAATTIPMNAFPIIQIVVTGIAVHLSETPVCRKSSQ